MITREEVSALVEANRTEPGGVDIGDIVVWAYVHKRVLDVNLRWSYGWARGLSVDDVYNIVAGYTDLALARVLEPLCGDFVVALRFATRDG